MQATYEVGPCQRHALKPYEDLLRPVVCGSATKFAAAALDDAGGCVADLAAAEPPPTDAAVAEAARLRGLPSTDLAARVVIDMPATPPPLPASPTPFRQPPPVRCGP